MPNATVTELDTKKKKCSGCGRLRGHKHDCPTLHEDAEPVVPPVGAGIAAAAAGVSDHPDLEDDVDDEDADDDDDIHERIDREIGDDEFIDGREFPPIALIPGALDALQESFNSGDFSGDVQRMKDCQFEASVDGDAMKCPNVAVIKKVVKKHCQACDRDKRDTVLELCIPHAINVFGGGAPHLLQTKMDFAS